MFFRAFFAIPPMRSEKGVPTNALYGFMSMSIKLLRDVKPEYIAYCFDRKEPSFRHEIYEDYKANREEMPEDLVPQIPYLKQLTDLLGIPRQDKLGFEADDIIGTLASVGRDHGLEVVIVSGDKDFAQLVTPQVTMYDTMKDVRYDVDGVVAKWGVKPEQMIDYLSLVGDSSDNIPGVKGIGPKGAQKLLGEFGSLEGIYKNLDKISSASLKSKLQEGKASAELSKRLVAIRTDVEIPVQPEDLRLKPIQREELGALFQELGFKSFERTLLSNNNKTSAPSATTEPESAASTNTEKAVRGKSKSLELKEVEWQTADFDKNIEPYTEIWADLNERGLFFCYKDQVIRCASDWHEVGQILSKKFLNWKGFDLKEIWKNLALQDPLPLWDQMLAAYVVRPEAIEMFPEVYTKYTGRHYMDLPTPTQIFECHMELEQVLKSKLKECESEKVLAEFELPLVPVLYAMEVVGVKLDTSALAKQSKDLQGEIRKLEQSIFDLCGGPFNIASPKQLAEILFGKLALTKGKKTKTGFSTNSDVLEKIRGEHAVVDLVLEYRELTKLKSTYVDALPGLMNAKTGRVHTHMRQAITTTGRLSSNNPNLQNIPIRTERGRLVRKAFVAAEGSQLISADYSQIELRVLAHMSGDKGLCEAFAKDIDIHTATAAEIFSVKASEVNADLRRKAKAVNFGIAYGQGVFGLSESLNIPRAEANEIIERYFQRYKSVKEYMDDTIRQGLEKGYVETAFGRRRYLDELKSRNQAVRKFGERAAINAPIQGTASDLVKLAMIRLHEEISAKMILQVHDELLFECPDEDVEDQIAIIRPIMENVTKFKVPFKVNIACGRNWEDAH